MGQEKARYEDFKPKIVPGIGIIEDIGDTVPSDGEAGYAPGCIFHHIDGTTYNTVLYCNIGTVTSCDFNVVTVAQ